MPSEEVCGGGHSHAFALSLVIPVLNEQESLPDLTSRLASVLDLLPITVQTVFIDDGSTDGSVDVIRNSRLTNVDIIVMGRNRGHQEALRVGWSVVDAPVVISLDGDGQHPPELIPLILKEFENSDLGVVYMVRHDSDGLSWSKRTTSNLFYFLMKRLTKTPLAVGAADFRGVSCEVIDYLRAIDGPVMTRIAIPQMGFPSKELRFQQPSRRFGTPKFSSARMARTALEAVLRHTELPLQFSLWIAGATTLFASAWSVYVLATFLTTGSVAGWASTMLAVLFSAAALSIVLFLQGQYLRMMSGLIFHKRPLPPVRVLHLRHEHDRPRRIQ